MIDWSQIIEKNTKVRLKIVGTRVDATEIVCLERFVSLRANSSFLVCDWDNKRGPPGCN